MHFQRRLRGRQVPFQSGDGPRFAGAYLLELLPHLRKLGLEDLASPFLRGQRLLHGVLLGRPQNVELGLRRRQVPF